MWHEDNISLVSASCKLRAFFLNPWFELHETPCISLTVGRTYCTGSAWACTCFFVFAGHAFSSRKRGCNSIDSKIRVDCQPLRQSRTSLNQPYFLWSTVVRWVLRTAGATWCGRWRWPGCRTAWAGAGRCRPSVRHRSLPRTAHVQLWEPGFERADPKQCTPMHREPFRYAVQCSKPSQVNTAGSVTACTSAWSMPAARFYFNLCMLCQHFCYAMTINLKTKFRFAKSASFLLANGSGMLAWNKYKIWS